MVCVFAGTYEYVGPFYMYPDGLPVESLRVLAGWLGVRTRCAGPASPVHRAWSSGSPRRPTPGGGVRTTVKGSGVYAE